ncbi:MAG: hypothetical protein RLZZ387_5067 [Chloroflexota bacterium]
MSEQFDVRAAGAAVMERQVQALDSDALTPLVQPVLDGADVVVETWSVEPLRAGNGALGVYRFSGVARGAAGPRPWAMVLKGIGDGADVSVRERLAYQSGALEDLRGVRAPRCYGVVRQPGGSWWLWLEALVDVWQHAWTLDHYHDAAQHLGQLSGASIGNQEQLALPWLSR